MERQRDMKTQKTLTSEAGIEARQAKQTRRTDKPGARVEQQAQVQHALNAFYRSPEVRGEKIEALRARIEAGTYQINRVALARKLLGITEQDAN